MTHDDRARLILMLILSAISSPFWIYLLCRNLKVKDDGPKWLTILFFILIILCPGINIAGLLIVAAVWRSRNEYPYNPGNFLD